MLRVKINGIWTVKRSHILSHIIFIGPIPKGQCVLHKCDNPSCVNPDHLFLGTRADNTKDRDKKNRHRALIGTKHGMSKLTEEDILKIRERRDSGELCKFIAKDYDVAPSTINKIVRRISYKDV